MVRRGAGAPPATGLTRRAFLGLSALAGAALVGARHGLGLGLNAVRRFYAPLPWHRRGDVIQTYNYCDMCPWRCGVIVNTVDGRVHKIEGNPADPKSRGKLCARGQAGVSFLYDPDRLKRPQIRTGPRGSGEFRDASWAEALDYIAERMLRIRDEYGAEAMAFFGHTSGDGWFTDYLPQAWGSPNAARPSSSLCLSPREEAAMLTLGRPIGGHEPVDWDAVECVTLIGTHIGEDSRNTMMQDFAAARARGARVIVVDPRFSTAASKATTWLPIKPGTDTALLLAWMNVLITERRYDAAFVAEWTEGFEKLSEHVAEFTPEWAAQVTDLAAADIAATARTMAKHAPASLIVPGRHTTWYGNDTQRMRAVYIVNALLGCYGRRGGLYFGKAPYIEPYPHPPFVITGSSGGCSAEPGAEDAPLPTGPTGKVRADGVRSDFLRGATAIQELIEPMITGEPYPIKGLLAYGVNLFHSLPDVARTKQALEQLDLVVAVDVLPQDHVSWADVVLPEATYLERYDDLWACSHKTPYVALREPAIAPLHETKPGWWIARELGLRLGLDHYFKWATAEEYLDARLISIGMSVAGLRQAGGVAIQNGRPYLEDHDTSPFGTASGKIELYSGTLEAAGHDPLPVYEPPEEPPSGWFRLLYGRHPSHTFGKTQNTPVLHELFPENEVWVNEGAAIEAGLRHGDRVVLRNQDGATSGPVRVKVTQRIRSDAVYLVHGFGHQAQGLTRANGMGASDTALQTRYALDPICGGAGMRVNFVTMEVA